MVDCAAARPLHRILTLLRALFKRERQPPQQSDAIRTFGDSGNVVTASDAYMRGNLDLFLQGLQASATQNQLRFWIMARIRAPTGASMLASVARSTGTSTSFIVVGRV